MTIKAGQQPLNTKLSARVAGAFASLHSTLKQAWPAGCDGIDFLLDVVGKDPKAVKDKLEGPVSNLRKGVPLEGVSVAASLFLARKCLPSPGTKEDAEGRLFRKLTQPGPEAAGDEWLDTAGDVVSRLFKKGWDASFLKYVELGDRVNATAGLKRGVSAREEVETTGSWKEWSERIASGDLNPISEIRRICAVEDGGKFRTVTVGSGFQAQLKPLHDLLYDTLSKNRWLLRGEPDSKDIAKMLAGEQTGFKDGRVFVSGDYEAATDNFCPWNSARLLALIFATSTCIPEGVMEAAYRSVLGGELVFGDIMARRVTGQLMGDYLSFPLLCLTNFVGFIHGVGAEEGWRIAETGLLLINGDDIVFYCFEALAKKWCEAVGYAGLVLSKGKTLIHPRVFSVNSCFFVASSRLAAAGNRYWHVRWVPVIRLKTWCKPGSRGLEGRVERIIKDASGSLTVLRGFFAYIWRRVLRGGLPVGLARALAAGEKRCKGCVPKGWKERVEWYVDHSLLMPSETGTRCLEAEKEFDQLFSADNLLVGRTYGKYSKWNAAAATARTAISWGRFGLEKKSKYLEDQGWKLCIPKPFVMTKFKIFDVSKWNRAVVREKVNRSYGNRAGIGAKTDVLWRPYPMT